MFLPLYSMAPSITSSTFGTIEVIAFGDPSSLVLTINMSNVIKLSSTNYLTWSIQIKALLRGYNLLQFIDSYVASLP